MQYGDNCQVFVCAGLDSCQDTRHYRGAMSSGYRPPSTEPKGRWARHIHAFRKAQGWSQTRGFEAVRAGLGLGEKSRAAYIAIDQGLRAPKPSEEEALAAVYGWPSDEPAPEVALEGQDALLAEIRALRLAVEAQTEAQTRGMAGLGAALTAVFLQLGGQPAQSPAGSSAPRGARAAGK